LFVNGSAFTGSSQWVGTTNIHNITGNVGIGTNNPTTAKLVVWGTAGAEGLDMSSTDQYANMRVIRNSLSGIDKHMYIGYQSGATSSLFFFSNNLGAMRCVSASVYIGELNNYDHGNTRLIVYGSGTYIVMFKHPNDTQGIGIQYDGITATNANQSVFIRPNGSGRFEVSACSNNTGTVTNLLYFGNNIAVNTIHKGNTYFSDCCAKFNGSIWATSWIGASSDARIKQNIQDIDDDYALQIILAIKPKKYEYIDKIAKGDNKVYGFIAQQIREVLPEAVSIQKSYIPNIMLLADYNNKIITLPSQPNYIIKINDKIRCNDKYNNIIEYEVFEIIDELTFKVKCDVMKEVIYADNKIFVYGVEIDDFHTLSKEYIFTMNVCATQELHRIIETQKVVIQAQEERINELETKMAQVLNHLSM
jgi:hypothetical protein